MSNKETRALTYALEAYLNGGKECDCGSIDFINTDDYIVECLECGTITDIEADYEDSKN